MNDSASRGGANLVRALACVLLCVSPTLALGKPLIQPPRCTSPLPKSGAAITLPGADVPVAFSRFLGRWNGMWNGRLCNTLVVLSVDSDGRASVVYSWGMYWRWGVKKPGFVVVSAAIEGDELILERFSGNEQTTYRFSDHVLHGTWRKGAQAFSATLSRFGE